MYNTRYFHKCSAQKRERKRGRERSVKSIMKRSRINDFSSIQRVMAVIDFSFVLFLVVSLWNYDNNFGLCLSVSKPCLLVKKIPSQNIFKQTFFLQCFRCATAMEWSENGNKFLTCLPTKPSITEQQPTTPHIWPSQPLKTSNAIPTEWQRRLLIFESIRT